MKTETFSLVRFSPDPEEIERVNVGVLMWGPPASLIVEPEYPRLRCVAASYDQALLGVYLNSLLGRAGDGPNHLVLSSQFEVSDVRQINDVVGVRTDDFLRAKYLKRPTSERVRANAVEQYVQTTLEDFLTHRVGVPARSLIRQAAPMDFLPAAIVQRHFASGGVRFARVIVGRRHVLAIDGMDRSRAVTYLERRGVRLGSAFYRLGKAKNEVEAATGREVVRAAVLFGERPEFQDERREYAEESLRRDADFTEEAASPSARFIQVATEAAGDLFQ